jgi:hypothetical protein
MKDVQIGSSVEGRSRIKTTLCTKTRSDNPTIRLHLVFHYVSTIICNLQNSIRNLATILKPFQISGTLSPAYFKRLHCNIVTKMTTYATSQQAFKAFSGKASMEAFTVCNFAVEWEDEDEAALYSVDATADESLSLSKVFDGENCLNEFDISLSSIPEVLTFEQMIVLEQLPLKRNFGDDAKPSLSLLDVFMTRPVKRIRADSIGASEPPLHRACCSSPSVAEIEKLLKADPNAAGRHATLKSTKLTYDRRIHNVVEKEVFENYHYPLNLAIHYKASAEVLTLLMEAAPEVLLAKDGSQGETSLAVLVKRTPQNLKAIDAMLLLNPKSAMTLDRHSNTCLHSACSAAAGTSLDVIRHLTIIYPEALTQRNFHGRTPLLVAQSRTATCSDTIVQFLSGFVRDDQEYL